MLVNGRLKEIIGDLETTLIGVSDLLFQLDREETLGVEDSTAQGVLRVIKKNLADLINKVAYDELHIT